MICSSFIDQKTYRRRVSHRFYRLAEPMSDYDFNLNEELESVQHRTTRLVPKLRKDPYEQRLKKTRINKSRNKATKRGHDPIL